MGGVCLVVELSLGRFATKGATCLVSQDVFYSVDAPLDQERRLKCQDGVLTSVTWTDTVVQG